MNKALTLITFFVFVGAKSFAATVNSPIFFKQAPVAKSNPHIVFANGFGGSGGFDFCFIINESSQCFSLIELGLRWSKPQVEGLAKNIYSQQEPIYVNHAAAFSAQTWFLTTEVITELNVIEIKLGELVSDLVSFVEGELAETFLVLPKEMRSGDDGSLSYSESEYLEALTMTDFRTESDHLKANALLGCIYTPLSVDSCKVSIKITAVSDSLQTHLYQSFFDLSPKQQAIKLLHEAFIRNCYHKQAASCLQEAHYYEGIVFDVISGQKISLEKEKDLKNYFLETRR